MPTAHRPPQCSARVAHRDRPGPAAARSECNRARARSAGRPRAAQNISRSYGRTAAASGRRLWLYLLLARPHHQSSSYVSILVRRVLTVLRTYSPCWVLGAQLFKYDICGLGASLQSSAGPPKMDGATSARRRTASWNMQLNGSLVINKWLQLPAPMRPRLRRPPLLPLARTESGTRVRHHIGRHKRRRKPRVVITPYNHQHGAGGTAAARPPRGSHP